MNSCPPFVRKTFQLVSDNNSNSIVSWSGNGKTFTIWNSQAFQKHVLPQYFKHNNLCSFVRQLNTYGFHKVNGPESAEGLEFSHPYFQQGCRNLLPHICRRKSKSKSPTRPSTDIVKGSTVSNTQVAEALISLARRQQESEQRLLSVCKELEEARNVIESLRTYDANSPTSLCGKRSYHENAFTPEVKKFRTEEPALPAELDILNMMPEFTTFDDLLAQPARCGEEIKQENMSFDINALLMDF